MKVGTVNVIGAGIIGLWQAYRLAKAGLFVRLFDKSDTPFEASSSRLAGAMLAPYCETEPSQKELVALALRSMELWNEGPCQIERRGTLIVAPARDRVELNGFAKRTIGHERIGAAEIGQLEDDLAGRFEEALYFKDEAHMAPRPALQDLTSALKQLGAEMHFGFEASAESNDFLKKLPEADFTIDARGMGSVAALRQLGQSLRPVRGEMAVIKLKELKLTRPVRLLHPRMPCYIVPWPDDHYMIGATVIESEDTGPVSLRAGLELLGAAFTVHPAFGEAKIIELSAGVRPSLPDNLPKIILDGRVIYVNGAYRHGFLLAPLLADAVCDYIECGTKSEELFE